VTIGTLILLGALLQPGPVEHDLSALAAATRQAFAERDFSRLFDQGQSVRLELPNHPVAVSVRGPVAAAALRDLVRRTRDLEIMNIGAAVVAPGHGYVELRRRFRVMGTQEEHAQRVLVSASLEAGHWRIAEVWIAPADRRPR